MEVINSVWDFFQTEILGMSWLNRLIETLLNACGLDTERVVSAAAYNSSFMM